MLPSAAIFQLLLLGSALKFYAALLHALEAHSSGSLSSFTSCKTQTHRMHDPNLHLLLLRHVNRSFRLIRGGTEDPRQLLHRLLFASYSASSSSLCLFKHDDPKVGFQAELRHDLRECVGLPVVLLTSCKTRSEMHPEHPADDGHLYQVLSQDVDHDPYGFGLQREQLRRPRGFQASPESLNSARHHQKVRQSSAPRCQEGKCHQSVVRSRTSCRFCRHTVEAPSPQEVRASQRS